MVVVRIEHSVPEYDGWKRAFDSDPANRAGSGVRRFAVLRQHDDPTFVMIDLAFDDVATAEAFLQKMQHVWGGAGKSVMRNPRALIAELVEERSL